MEYLARPGWVSFLSARLEYRAADGPLPHCDTVVRRIIRDLISTTLSAITSRVLPDDPGSL
jgi:hypothetical protein